MNQKLCYECGAVKDSVCYKASIRSDGHVRCCINCEAEYPEAEHTEVIKVKTPIHIDAFKNMRNQPSDTGYVYFVKEVDRGNVLVGHTHNITEEMCTLRQHFYEDLICLLVLPGTPKDVDNVKTKFSDYYQHDNWLSYGGELTKWIIRTKFKKQPSMDFALSLVKSKQRTIECDTV